MFFQVSSKVANLEIKLRFKVNLAAMAHNYTNTKPEKNLMLEVIRNIKKNDKIFLAKPHKGLGIVVLNKKEYFRKNV